MDGAGFLSSKVFSTSNSYSASLLILIGIPCVLAGIAVFFFLPNNTDTAYFLTEKEKLICAARRSTEYGQTNKAQKFSRTDCKKAFKDWKIYVFAFAHFGVLNMLYGKLKFRVQGITPRPDFVYRFFYLLTNYHRWTWEMDHCSSPTTHHSVLFLRR